MAIVYPLKLKEEIMPLTELKSKEDHTNKSIVLKQFLYEGVENYMLNLINGKIKYRQSCGNIGIGHL